MNNYGITNDGVLSRQLFWATVCKAVRPVLLDRFSSVCLYVCDVGVLWPNGRMNQHANRCGVGPRHTVLHGDPAFPKWAQQPLPNLRQCVLWPNVWMDQDATWYGGRPWPRRHWLWWVPSSPITPTKGENFFPSCISRKPLNERVHKWMNGWMKILMETLHRTRGVLADHLHLS